MLTLPINVQGKSFSFPHYVALSKIPQVIRSFFICEKFPSLLSFLVCFPDIVVYWMMCSNKDYPADSISIGYCITTSGIWKFFQKLHEPKGECKSNNFSNTTSSVNPLSVKWWIICIFLSRNFTHKQADCMLGGAGMVQWWEHSPPTMFPWKVSVCWEWRKLIWPI